MKIYELLDSPEKWTKGSIAKNTVGFSTDEFDINACKWCLLGALYKCYSD